MAQALSLLLLGVPGTDSFLEAYVGVQQALAADDLAAARNAARILVERSEKADFGNDYEGLAEGLRDDAAAILKAADISAAREAFGLVSKALAPWAGKEKPKGYDLVWCSMLRSGWLQKAGPIRNPYHGKSMLECGQKVHDASAASD